MAFKFIKKRWQKILAVELIGLAIIVFVIGLLINIYWSPIVSDRLKTIVNNSSDGLYKIDFSDAQLHFLQGKIVIHNINLRPDTATYNRLRSRGLAPNNLIELRLKRLVLKNIHPLRLYFKKELEIGDVIFSAPNVHVTYQLNHLTDTVAKDKRTLYQQIASTLKKVHIGNILFNDVELKYEDRHTAQPKITELRELNFNAIDFLVDSASQFNKKRYLYCSDVTAELYNYIGKSANCLYSYSAKEISFSTKTSQLKAYKCSLVATRKLTEFFKYTYRDQFVFNLDSLQINHFDFQGYNKYHNVHASTVSLTNGGLNIFGNPRLNPKKVNADRINSFPNQAIFNIPIDLKIDTVKVKNIDLVYREYGVKTNREGHIGFYDIAGNMLNITNNKEAVKLNPVTLVKFKSRFMKKAPIETEFTFDLADSLRSYSYKGSLGVMKLSDANPIAVPLGSLSVNGGQCKGLFFDIKADKNSSRGKVTFLYSNLRVHLLKADTVNEKMHHLRIASIIANNGILKRNNPDTIDAEPRSAILNLPRPKNFPFFKTMLQTLISGIKPCTGFDEKTQQAVKARMAQHEIDKALRKQKKALRKARKDREKARRNFYKK
ncbi:AsmA family protein [Mucilaginibacter ginkgonis]|uniref:AsmA-like protein n=1 Tax=Mucilaginibacter ginkgonis TaxID=2682091 RepID=A0A6I4I463_9SPHI|nr:hypothetical protein [Mucilaginibacter ginkgonis]QQL48779.1 hypothetical protein GO620_011385 [Mucilaginibacter ginkgonis]